MGTSFSFPVQKGRDAPSSSSAINSTLMIMWNGLSPEDEHIAFYGGTGSPSNCMTKESIGSAALLAKGETLALGPFFLSNLSRSIHHLIRKPFPKEDNAFFKKTAGSGVSFSCFPRSCTLFRE